MYSRKSPYWERDQLALLAQVRGSKSGVKNIMLLEYDLAAWGSNSGNNDWNCFTDKFKLNP